MSCHTWGYKKVSALDEEYKRKEVEKEIKEMERIWILTAPKEEVIEHNRKYYAEMRKDYPDWKKCQKEYGEREYNTDIRTYRRRLERLKTEGFDYLVKLKKYTVEVERHKGEYYWNITFDTPFRLYGYPEDHFYDCEKLLKFLKKHSDDVCFYDENGEKDSGYSEELEKQVRDFFKKHGEDNLYFEFG